MKPSQVKVLKAVSVQFARIERLAHQKKRADAYVGRIQVLLSEDEDSELTCGGTQKLEEYVHGLCGIAWGNDPLWHDEETRWLADYGIQVHDEDIAVRNHASEGKKVFDFPRHGPKDPAFDISCLTNSNSLEGTDNPCLFRTAGRSTPMTTNAGVGLHYDGFTDCWRSTEFHEPENLT